MAALQPGQRLWSWTPGALLGHVRRLLVLLGEVEPNRFTLKAFRAGKATALAAAGHSVGHILLAGEWRSRAFLRYIDEEVIDAAQLLVQTLETSDNEGEG